MHYYVNFEKKFRTPTFLDFGNVTNPANNSFCVVKTFSDIFRNSGTLNGRRFFNFPSQKALT